MRLKYPFEIMEVAGQKFAISVEEPDAFNGVVKVSKTAAFIFELLREETTEEAIVERMSQRYDAPRDTLAADVHGLIAKLAARGLLT